MENLDVLGGLFQILAKLGIQGGQGFFPKRTRYFQRLQLHPVELPGHGQKGLILVSPNSVQEVLNHYPKLGFVGWPSVQEMLAFLGGELRNGFVDGEFHGVLLKA
jgi:hypothetical protein